MILIELDMNILCDEHCVQLYLRNIIYQSMAKLPCEKPNIYNVIANTSNILEVSQPPKYLLNVQRHNDVLSVLDMWKLLTTC